MYTIWKESILISHHVLPSAKVAYAKWIKAEAMFLADILGQAKLIVLELFSCFKSSSRELGLSYPVNVLHQSVIHLKSLRLEKKLAPNGTKS